MKRSLKVTAMIKGCLATLFAAIVLVGCANNPLMRTGSATSTDSVEAIDRTLERALADSRAAEDKSDSAAADAASADAIAAALMPSLGTYGGEPASGRFDVQANALEARSFFRSLVKGTPYNVAVHPDVEGMISVDLQSVTLPEVMDLVSDLYGYEIHREGDFYRVLPGGLRTRMFQIDYLNMVRRGGSETQVSSGSVSAADDGGSEGGGYGDEEGGDATRLVGTRIVTETESHFWRALEQALLLLVGTGEGHRVIVTPGTGVVVVRAMPDQLQAVEDYLRRTQLIVKRQVVLEAKILEVVLNEGYQQGIDWDFFAASSSLDANGIAKKSIVGSLAGQVVTNGDVNGVFSAALRIGDFSTLISLLGTQGNVQVLSSPRIATTNNQKAVIKVGSDEFFVTDIDFNDDNNALGATNSTSTSVELTPFFSGISLDVTPQISAEGLITLHVHPSVSEVSDQEKVITVGERDVTLPLALSTVRETDSIINARSGQIVVIGGLIQNQSEDRNSAVPFFSEIPVIGELFKQRNFSSRKSELVILLRPIIAGERTNQTDIAAAQARIDALKSLLTSPEAPLPEPAR